MQIEKDTQALAKPQSGMIEVAQSRAAQEVQAAMIVAKRFPRDQIEAVTKILQGCRRMTLAKESQYAYPRGGSRVSGPSIRLAEHLLQNWGNCESGIIELERKEGESVCMAYAVDLETNSREVRVFNVPHVRDRSESKGGSVALTESRDIYELVANHGARRKRACMLAIVPGDVVDQAIEECNKTLAGDTKEPLIDRVRKMAVEYSDLGVNQAMIEARLGHKLDATVEAELVGLVKIFISIRDNFSKREDWFTLEPVTLAEGKSGFGFKKKPEEKAPATVEKKAEPSVPEKTVPVAQPGSVTEAEVEDAAGRGQGPGVDEALVAEARAREQAEEAQQSAATQPPPVKPDAPLLTAAPPQAQKRGRTIQRGPDPRQEILDKAKEKGIPMQAVLNWAETHLDTNFMLATEEQMQQIRSALHEHPYGKAFE